jgi:hypothetical protein
LAGDDLFHPILGGGGGEVAGEVKHQHGVGPGGGEEFLPLVQRGQAEGAASGAKTVTG